MEQYPNQNSSRKKKKKKKPGELNLTKDLKDYYEKQYNTLEVYSNQPKEMQRRIMFLKDNI